MTINLIIHCDKCDSTEVLHEEIEFKPQDEHKTMTQVVERNSSFHSTCDVYCSKNYRMVCKSCGHIVKYSR